MENKDAASVPDAAASGGAVESLPVSEAEFRASFYSAAVGHAQVDPVTGRYLRVNAKFCAITGYSEVELQRMTFLDLTHPEDRESDHAAHQRLSGGEIPELCREKRYVRKDGGIVWVNVSVSLIRDAAGRSLRTLAVVQDITSHKQAVQDIAHERQLLRTLIDNLPGCIFIKDAAGRYLISNRAHTALLGAAAESELLGKTVFDHFPPEIAQVFDRDDKTLLQTGQPVIEREEQYEANGRSVWHQLTKVPLRDAQGRIVGLIGVRQDITEHKRMQETLSHSEKLFHSVWDKSADGMRLTDKDGIVMAVNVAYCQLTGLSMEEMVGQPFTVTYAGADPETLLRKYRERFASRTIEAHLERRVTYRSGKVVDLMVSNSFVEMGQSEPLLLGIFHDITGRKQAEDVLRQSEQRFRSFVTASSQVVWTTDPTGKVITDLPEWQAFTGQSAEEARGFGWMNAIHPEDRDRTSEAWRQAHESRRFYEVEYRLRIHTGEWRHIQARGVPVLEADGGIREWVGTCIDISERKRAEELLRRSEERYRTTIDNILEGCQLIGFDWRYLYLNDTAVRHYRRPKEELLGRKMAEAWPGIETTKAFVLLRCCMEERIAFHEEIEFVYPDGGKGWFDIRCQPVPEGIFVLSIDISDRKQAETHVRQLNRVYAVLSDINQVIVRTREPQELFASACRIAVEKGSFHMAWIGLVNPRTGRVDVMGHAGTTGDYLTKLDILPGDEARGHGPTSQAIRTGAHIICNDIERDPRMAPWRADALRLGFRAVAAFPLKVGGENVGNFNLYSAQAGFFDSEETRLLDELAMDIGFALEVSQREAERRQGEQKIREQIHELLRWQNAMLAREDRVLQVKAEVNELLARQGQPPRYSGPTQP